jgi:UDP-N-acetylglucosamine diphosphorylase/glucosamine-1-phosphate N-acetyltransferase
LKNEEAINRDFAMLTKGRKSKPIGKSNQIIGKGKIFLEEGVKMECAFLNASDGPIYIGKNAEVMEGSMIRGPFALGESSTLKMGTKIYGGTTIGPHCKVGGEVSNSVFFGYSNKAHDGFIGNSVIGEWCNLGANTNNSNLKNNYSKVKVWNYYKKDYVDSGLTFCGLMMGDHSKSSISSMFNTGTVVGVSANIFGSGFPPKMIPSFAWGGSNGFTTFRMKDALELAQRVMERRHIKLTKVDAVILKAIFDQTESEKKQTAKMS